MKKSRFTDSQIIEAIKRAEAGLAVPELCREPGISSATFYKWRAKFGGTDVSMMSRMKGLEAENARLREMYVEEKLKAELRTEALEKKWWGHLVEARWPSTWCASVGFQYAGPARWLTSARLATGTSASAASRTMRLQTG